MEQSAIQKHIEALKDDDVEVREEAVRALGGIGPDAGAAVPALIDAIEEDALCWAAVEALGSIGGKVAMRALCEALLKDVDMGVRMRAGMALRRIRDEEAVPALIMALNDMDEFVRESAAVALGDIADQTAVPALNEALNDREDFVRKAAAAALKKIKGD